MGDRISFSLKLLQFEKVAVSHADMERSIRFYYSAPSLATRDPKFLGCSAQEIQQELHLRLDELEMNSVFSLFGALEASFR